MSKKRMAHLEEAPRATVRHHQPGQADFRGILSKEIEWKPFAAFPPTARLAIVVGEPAREGSYTIRVKLPHGTKMMPHSHPEDRMYTVISGIFYIGLGDKLDAEKLQAYISLSLGKVRRVHHAGNCDWAAWP
jgi:quercetin dioxygenase-like cupin family protein